MVPGPPEMEERCRRFLEGRGDDEIAPLFCFLRSGRRARAHTESWAALILSRIYILRGAIDLAASYLRIASSRAGGAPESLRLGILVNHAIVRRSRGRPAEAAALFGAVVDRALRSRELFVAAKAASNGALALAGLGRTAEAESYAGLAERLYASMRSVEGGARISLIRAVIDLRRGAADEAIDRLARALGECGGVDRERERLIALLLAVEAHIARREPDRAREALECAGAMREALVRFPPQRARLCGLVEILAKGWSGAADGLRYEAIAVDCGEMAVEMRERAIDPGEAAASSRGGVLVAAAQIGEERFVTRDPAAAALLDRIRRASRLGATLLLRGESGVGKDLIARLVHRWSGRGDEPFVPVNAPSIPAELFESVLFGHARGAFTGAVCRRGGLAEAAGRGTLFLDEIGELPAPLQPKLLRFLDGGEFFALGETSPRRSGARIVCATNRDLAAACEQGSFRRDLYHRIAALSFVVPPLRERRGDIAPLAEYLLARSRARHGIDAVRLHPEALSALASYDWP